MRKRPSAEGAPDLVGKSYRDQLLRIYELLYAQFGSQHWWPGEDPFEVIVGAILAQNTSWKNVEKAITNLKGAGALFPGGIATLSLPKLAELIRPSGTYRIKADRLLQFVAFFKEHYGFSFEAMFRVPLPRIRAELLAVEGIGPETADSILLYAGGYPVFVVDAYTKRIFSRHGFIRGACAYEELQALFMEALPTDVPLFNEYHALIVRLGKSRCRARPICEDCVLQSLLLGNEKPRAIIRGGNSRNEPHAGGNRPCPSRDGKLEGWRKRIPRLRGDAALKSKKRGGNH